MRNLVMILVCVFMIAGCAGFVNYGPGGAGPGTIVTNATYPAENNTGTTYNFNKDDFTIIGPVTAEAHSKSILGILASGDSGYGKLYEEAKKQGADDVIAVKVDVHFNCILGIIANVKMKLHGVAIKWNKK